MLQLNHKTMIIAGIESAAYMGQVTEMWQTHIDGLVQERHNAIANALDLCLSSTNPPIWYWG